MEPREVLLVDAFADEPLAGVAVAVLPTGEEVTDAQLRAVGGELDVPAVCTQTEDGIICVDLRAGSSAVAAGVGAGIGLLDRDAIEPGEHSLSVRTPEDEHSYSVSVTPERSVSVSLPSQSVRDADVSLEEIAACLTLDVAALESVGPELPPGVVTAFGDSLYVAVNYLEQLGNIDVERTLFESLLGDADVSRVVPFTFDTLQSASEIHARIFEVGADQGSVFEERAVSGVAAGGLGTFLSARDAFDEETTEVRIEAGHFLDRPATVRTDLGPAPEVSGYGLISLDGRITVPADDADDIIEV